MSRQSKRARKQSAAAQREVVVTPVGSPQQSPERPSRKAPKANKPTYVQQIVGQLTVDEDDNSKEVKSQIAMHPPSDSILTRAHCNYLLTYQEARQGEEVLGYEDLADVEDAPDAEDQPHSARQATKGKRPKTNLLSAWNLFVAGETNPNQRVRNATYGEDSLLEEATSTGTTRTLIADTSVIGVRGLGACISKARMPDYAKLSSLFTANISDHYEWQVPSSVAREDKWPLPASQAYLCIYTILRRFYCILNTAEVSARPIYTGALVYHFNAFALIGLNATVQMWREIVIFCCDAHNTIYLAPFAFYFPELVAIAQKRLGITQHPLPAFLMPKVPRMHTQEHNELEPKYADKPLDPNMDDDDQTHGASFVVCAANFDTKFDQFCLHLGRKAAAVDQAAVAIGAARAYASPVMPNQNIRVLRARFKPHGKEATSWMAKLSFHCIMKHYTHVYNSWKMREDQPEVAFDEFIAKFMPNCGTEYGRYFEHDRTTLSKIYIALERAGLAPKLEAVAARIMQWRQFEVAEGAAPSPLFKQPNAHAQYTLAGGQLITLDENRERYARNEAEWQPLELDARNAPQDIPAEMQVVMREPSSAEARVILDAKKPFFMNQNKFRRNLSKAIGPPKNRLTVIRKKVVRADGEDVFPTQAGRGYKEEEIDGREWQVTQHPLTKFDKRKEFEQRINIFGYQAYHANVIGASSIELLAFLLVNGRHKLDACNRPHHLAQLVTERSFEWLARQLVKAAQDCVSAAADTETISYAQTFSVKRGATFDARSFSVDNMQRHFAHHANPFGVYAHTTHPTSLALSPTFLRTHLPIEWRSLQQRYEDAPTKHIGYEMTRQTCDERAQEALEEGARARREAEVNRLIEEHFMNQGEEEEGAEALALSKGNKAKLTLTEAMKCCEDDRFDLHNKWFTEKAIEMGYIVQVDQPQRRPDKAGESTEIRNARLLLDRQKRKKLQTQNLYQTDPNEAANQNAHDEDVYVEETADPNKPTTSRHRSARK